MDPEIVVIVMTVAPALFILFDVYLAFDRREGNTYSAILSQAGKKWLPLVIMISFGMGLLCGHWWWPVATPPF